MHSGEPSHHPLSLFIDDGRLKWIAFRLPSGSQPPLAAFIPFLVYYPYYLFVYLRKYANNKHFIIDKSEADW